MPNPIRYTRIAQSVHWLMAILILGCFAVGLVMTDWPFSPRKLQVYSWHKWAGVTVFVLLWVRLAWRVTHRPPPAPTSMSALQVRAANGVHHLLYVLMLAVPLTGWLMSSAKGFPTVWFGVVPLPDLLGKSDSAAEWLENAHALLAWAIVLLAAGHAAAALKHHFIDRDDVLRRMLPGRR